MTRTTFVRTIRVRRLSQVSSDEDPLRSGRERGAVHTTCALALTYIKGRGLI